MDKPTDPGKSDRAEATILVVDDDRGKHFYLDVTDIFVAGFDGFAGIAARYRDDA